MAGATTLKLRGLWLSVHKWIGLLLAVLIIPVSVTGSALVWHDGLDDLLNPQRVVEGRADKAPGDYAAAVQGQLQDGERIASARWPEDGEGAVQVVATRPPAEGQRRAPRTTFWVHPESMEVLDTARGGGGAVQFLHVLHGSLQIPNLGRQIVGWVGVFMLISCLTGIWLWWPVTGSVARGFRWRRQPSFNANLHHQLGFWVLIPLAMLSATGVWISFPQTFSGFEASAEKAPAPKQAGPPRPAQPLERTALTIDQVLAEVGQAGSGRLATVTWPTDQKAEWQLTFDGGVEAAVEDRPGGELRVGAPEERPETIARVMRRWHDGQGMGFVWQLLIFIGGIIPAILAVTGILMWWRSRKWRGGAKKRAKPAPVPAAAE